MKTIAYVRVSTDDQKTDLQKDSILRFCQSRQWAEPEFLEDKLSGRTANRPALKSLLEQCKNGKVETIMVWRLDRLFRSLQDLLQTLQALDSWGVRFVSVQDNIDLGTASGRLMLQVVGAFAEFESNLNRERTISGMRAAKQRGVRFGRPVKHDYQALAGKIRSLKLAHDKDCHRDQGDQGNEQPGNQGDGKNRDGEYCQKLSVRDLAARLRVPKAAIQRALAVKNETL
jgi:DNA invertase Pin-like site-specific DNA recombinase